MFISLIIASEIFQYKCASLNTFFYCRKWKETIKNQKEDTSEKESQVGTDIEPLKVFNERKPRLCVILFSSVDPQNMYMCNYIHTRKLGPPYHLDVDLHVYQLQTQIREILTDL
ncbi:uncharacterized protein LOC105663110 [Megachile rotundata]|uniref:uncharacterized protein LOC105663110 n=1 Tax=Megachile rotundata TaxID=143995 RepID=UPI003FD5D572